MNQQKRKCSQSHIKLMVTCLAIPFVVSSATLHTDYSVSHCLYNISGFIPFVKTKLCLWVRICSISHYRYVALELTALWLWFNWVPTTYGYANQQNNHRKIYQFLHNNQAHSFLILYPNILQIYLPPV